MAPSGIWVDLRHPHPGHAHDAFVEKFGGQACSMTLTYGDIAFFSGDGAYAVAIEVKKAQDLVESVVHSGRLVEQLRGARSDIFKWQYAVILEGFKHSGRDADGDFAMRRRGTWEKVIVPGTRPPRGVSWQRVDSFLNTLAIYEGVPIKMTGSEGETVEVITGLYKWWQRPLDEHTSTTENRVHVPLWLGPAQEIPLLRRWAGELDGVGIRRGKEIAKVFSSALEMVEATPDDWERVEGIGTKLAHSIYREIRKASRHG